MRSVRLMLVALFLFACGVRAVYGGAKYGAHLSDRGISFLKLWDHDALEHLLIAKAISEGKGYVVDDDPSLPEKHVRNIGGDAQFKAPLYSYLLAAMYGMVGIGFAAFIPFQAFAGGLMAVIASRITLRLAPGDLRAALVTGVLVAMHPILVNTAVQPYNENVFFLLFLAAVAFYFRWLDEPSLASAVPVGLVGGLGVLTRESILAPLLALSMLAPLLISRGRRVQGIRDGALMIGLAAVLVVPWTLYNFSKLGSIVPVSAISGTALGAGNNECVAAYPLNVPFYGDVPCPALDRRRAPVLDSLASLSPVVALDRATKAAGVAFIRENPGDYLRLCIRRAWTTFLPAHPMQQLSIAEAFVMYTYMALVLIPGIAAMVVMLTWRNRDAMVLSTVMLASYAPLVLVFVSQDHRYRIGLDLVAACFAGPAWAAVSRLLQRRFLGAAVRDPGAS